MPKVSILIPTYNRPCALAATLTSLCFQEFKDFEVIVSDQGDLQKRAYLNGTFLTAKKILEHHGNRVELLEHLPKKGIAEHRDFLLSRSRSPLSLFLDDDIILEPWALINLVRTIEAEQCGFVGMGVIGLEYENSLRAGDFEQFEFWEGKVLPEKITPASEKWKRSRIHNRANTLYLARKYALSPDRIAIYKVAWVGACVLYNTLKLRSSGGFSFWKHLPEEHSGEDVFAQLRVMQKYGGCGILPSGAYYQQLPTTIPNREIDAPSYLSD